MGNTDALRQWMRAHPNRPVSIREMAEAMPFSRAAVNNALVDLGREPQLEKLERSVWRWNGAGLAQAAKLAA